MGIGNEDGGSQVGDLGNGEGKWEWRLIVSDLGVGEISKLAALGFKNVARVETMSEERIIRSFEDLDCWKARRDVRLFVAKVIIPEAAKRRALSLG